VCGLRLRGFALLKLIRHVSARNINTRTGQAKAAAVTALSFVCHNNVLFSKRAVRLHSRVPKKQKRARQVAGGMQQTLSLSAFPFPSRVRPSTFLPAPSALPAGAVFFSNVRAC